MGLSGTSGPFRGAYNTFVFSTGSAAASSPTAGTDKHYLWRYTLPAGMDIVVVDIQLYAGQQGTPARVNIEADGTSILSNTVNSAASQGVGLTTAASVVATPSNAVFGTTTKVVTPAIGAYVVGGSILAATVSNGSTAAGTITGTILWYPATHPNLVRSAYE